MKKFQNYLLFLRKKLFFLLDNIYQYKFIFAFFCIENTVFLIKVVEYKFQLGYT